MTGWSVGYDADPVQQSDGLEKSALNDKFCQLWGFRGILCVTAVCYKDGHKNGGKCQNSYISPKEKPPPTVKADEGSHRRSKPLLVRVKFSFWDPLHELGVWPWWGPCKFHAISFGFGRSRREWLICDGKAAPLILAADRRYVLTQNRYLAFSSTQLFTALGNSGK